MSLTAKDTDKSAENDSAHIKEDAATHPTTDTPSDNDADSTNEDDVATDSANDNDEMDVSHRLIEIKFQTKGRYVYFTTEDEKVAETLKRYSELLLKNAHDPDTGDFDQERLPKSTELKSRIMEHFQEQDNEGDAPKIYYSRIVDISSDSYKNAKLEDVIPDYPHPDKVAERSVTLEEQSKKSVIQSTGFELGSSLLFVGLAVASANAELQQMAAKVLETLNSNQDLMQKTLSSLETIGQDKTVKKIGLTVFEAMFVLVPLAHSYKSSNASIKAHESALAEFSETGDERAFDTLGTGLQTRVPYQHHSHDNSLKGALVDSLKEAATVIVDPVGIYKDWKKSPKTLKSAFGLKGAISNPYNFGVTGGALRNLYLNGIQVWSTGKVMRDNGHEMAKGIKYKMATKAYSIVNRVFKTDFKAKEPITIAPPKPEDHVKFIFIPSTDGKNRRVIRTEMPSHSNISAITTTADPERMLTMRNAAQKSWRKDHGKIATGLIGIGAAGLFCYNLAPLVAKSFQTAAENPTPVNIALSAAWTLTIAMGAAAGKHFMHDREKIHVALQSKQAFAAFKDSASAHMLELRHEFKTKVHESVENGYVTPLEFDEIIKSYRKLPMSAVDEDTRDLFEKYFPEDDDGRRSTTLFSSTLIEPVEAPAPD